MLKYVRPLSTSWLLGSILSLAILLRVCFFVGLVAGDPQDDGWLMWGATPAHNGLPE